MTQRTVSIRLSPEGGPEIKRLFDDIAGFGDASAQRLKRSYERASEDVEAALQRRRNAEAKIAAIMPATAKQMGIDQAVGTGFGEYEGSARRSAAAIRELLREQEQMEERTRRLLGALDPAAAAQDRFNAEMAEARALVSAGTLTLDQYCDKLRQERGLLDASNAARARGARSAGAFNQAMAGASYQAQDFITQISMGANPINAFTVQGMQLAGQMAGLEGRVGAAARVIMGPWGLAISGGLLLLGYFTKGLLDGESAAEQKKKAAESLTQSIDDLGEATRRQNQSEQENKRLTLEAAAALRQKALDARAATIEQIRLARANVAANLAQAGRRDGMGDGGGAASAGSGALAVMGLEQLRGLDAQLAQNEAELARTQVAFRDAQLPILRQRAAEATDAAAAATGRYDRSVDALNKRFAAGEISQAAYTSEYIRLTGEKDSAVEQAQRSQERSARANRDETAAANDNSAAQLALARAYLTGGQAATRAALARENFGEALAGELASGARTLDQLRDETAARAAVRAQVLAGTLPAEQMDAALREEAALRPLLKLQLVAQGEALEVLTRIINDYRAALAAAREEEARGAAARSIKAARDRVADLIAEGGDIGLSRADAAENAAKRAANREADQGNYNEDERAQLVARRIEQARLEIANDRRRAAVDLLAQQEASIALADADLRLAGASDAVRGRKMERLRLILDLKRDGIDLDSAEGRQALANHAALADIVDQIERKREAMDALRDVGTELVETVLSPETWDDWGEGGRRIIGMLKAELIKLALINPLKNMLFGESNATIGSVLGLFAPKGAGTALPGHEGFHIPGLAAGTRHWSGGAMLVGEFGPEILSAPRGASVIPAGETRRMLSGGGVARGGNTIVINADNAVLAEQVRGWVAEGIDIAAARGATGGAQMAELESAGRMNRRLGRRW